MDGLAAIEQISRNCFRSFAVVRNAELLDDGRIFGVMTGLSIPFFSGIASTNIAEDEVAAVIDIFRAKQCAFRWWLTPMTRPEGLGALLEANGLRHVYDARGMAAELSTLHLDVPLPAGVTIRQLASIEEMEDWLDVFMLTYSVSPGDTAIWRDVYDQCGFGNDAVWTHFLTFLDGAPVAIASLLLEGTLAGIYCVGTLPEARGKGIGAAITRAAMRCGRDRGATTAALQSSDAGYSVYLALGFVDYCNLRLYDWRPEY